MAMTVATIRTNYQTYSDWYETKSVSRARKFITWATRLIEASPSSGGQGSNTASFRIDLVEKQIERARTFVERHDADGLRGPNVTHASFSSFRGA